MHRQFTTLARATLTLAAVAAFVACGPGNNGKNNGGNNGTNNDTNNDTNSGTNNGTNNGDPCSGKTNTCDTAGATCDGDTLVTCAEDADGCLVETTLDCATDGQVCDGSASPAACADTCDDDPLCAGLSDGDQICDGASVVTCEMSAGCLVANATDCADGEFCDDSTGTPMCQNACPEAVQTLSCADVGQTIMGDTSNGSTVFGTYECGIADRHVSTEGIYRFEHDETARITISVSFDSMTDLDVFALDGTGEACAEGLACLDSSSTVADTEEVTFDVMPGETAFVVVDEFGEMAGMGAPYTLEVQCEVPTCGDGLIGAGEQCDDSNSDAGDGCSDTCQVEQDYVCDGGEPTTCTPDICGDGIISFNEACDDGDTDAGDGCSADCGVEFAYECTGEPSTCMSVPDIGTFGAGDVIADTTSPMLPDGESDEYTITFSDNVLLSGTLTASMGDPDLLIHDADGLRSFIGTAGNEDFSDRFLPAGTYVLEVVAFSDLPDYTLTLSTETVPDIGTFGAGDMISDTTGMSIADGESDVYTIEFTENVVISGSLTAAMGDPDLRVETFEGATFLVQDATGGETFSDQFLPAGQYVVYVPANAAVQDYVLSLSTSAVSDAGSFAAGDMISDWTGGPLDRGEIRVQQYTFTDDVMLSGTLSSGTGDPDFFVLEPSGEVITSSGDDGGEDFDIALPAGTYVFGINAWDGATAGVDTFTLTLSTAALMVPDIGTFAAGDPIMDQTGGPLTATEFDHYTITFTEDVLLDGSLGGNSTGEMGLLIYDADSSELSLFDMGDDVFSGVEIEAGTYIVQIQTFSETLGGGDVDAYTLTLSSTAP